MGQEMSQLLSILLKLLQNIKHISSQQKYNKIHQSTFKAAFLFLNMPNFSLVSLPAFHLHSVKVQAFSSAPYPEPDILVILLVVMTIPTTHHPAVHGG